MLKDKERFWVKLLSHKYLKQNRDWGSTKHGSFVWKSISKVYMTIKEGLGWQTGSSLQSWWYDPWIPLGWIWKLASLKGYTTKSRYIWLAHMKFQWRGDGNWKWLWKLSIPEKVRFLFWLALNDVIPTNVFRHKRGLAVSDLCNKYSHESESVLHCLWDCCTARHIWNSLDPSIVEHVNASDFLSWITSIINGKEEVVAAEI
ncbi:hypothetical protein AHAS_Ahas15G0168100 [Arachis hypogaea]